LTTISCDSDVHAMQSRANPISRKHKRVTIRMQTLLVAGSLYRAALAAVMVERLAPARELMPKSPYRAVCKSEILGEPMFSIMIL